MLEGDQVYSHVSDGEGPVVLSCEWWRGTRWTLMCVVEARGGGPAVLSCKWWREGEGGGQVCSHICGGGDGRRDQVYSHMSGGGKGRGTRCTLM